MPRVWEIKIGHVTVMPRKTHSGDSLELLIDRNKLQLAIAYASQMARKAHSKLEALKRGELNEQDKFELQYALAKYFSISSIR